MPAWEWPERRHKHKTTDCFRSMAPLSLPLPSTLSHLRCTHWKYKPDRPCCCQSPPQAVLTCWMLVRFLPLSPSGCLLLVTPVPSCVLHTAALFWHGWTGHPAPLRVLSYPGNRSSYFPTSEGQRLLAGGSRSTHGTVLLCQWVRRALSQEQAPPPPFPWSCLSGQSDNRHLHISAPLNLHRLLP